MATGFFFMNLRFIKMAEGFIDMAMGFIFMNMKIILGFLRF